MTFLKSTPASKPIEDYALLGDGRTVALVARDGAVDWLCWPCFDSDACFAALLGGEAQGTWRIASEGDFTTTRSYRGDTLVLDTEFTSATCMVRLTDLMPLPGADGSALVRHLEGLVGEVTLAMLLRPRFAFGEVPPWWIPIEGGWHGVVGPDLLVLRGSTVERQGDQLHARITLRAGEVATFVLQHRASHDGVPDPVDAAAALAATIAAWQSWITRFDKPTDWPQAVKRSLLTLRALTHHQTGGIVAAPTLGLPEKPGGSMNWDHRYCWLRDSTITLAALLNAGFHDEARDWLDWLLRAIAGAPDKMQIMYRVDGGRRVDETELPHLPGWNGVQPVRLGNAAATQRQLDVFREVLDSASLAQRAGIDRSEWGAKSKARLVAHLEHIWQEPDLGMWESRAAPQHYVYSKVMAWVAIDRFLRLSPEHALGPARRASLDALRATMHVEICDKSFNAARGTFTQHYGSTTLDACLLLLPLVGFLSATDQRMVATISAIKNKLSEGGLIRRQEAPFLGGTVLRGEEGVFLACSCWLADCMALQGQHGEARTLFERVLAVGNDLGLLSEEYHVPSQRLMGNFPPGADAHRHHQHRVGTLRSHHATRRRVTASRLHHCCSAIGRGSKPDYTWGLAKPG